MSYLVRTISIKISIKFNIQLIAAIKKIFASASGARKRTRSSCCIPQAVQNCKKTRHFCKKTTFFKRCKTAKKQDISAKKQDILWFQISPNGLQKLQKKSLSTKLFFGGGRHKGEDQNFLFGGHFFEVLGVPDCQQPVTTC